MGASHRIAGFTYLPRQDGNPNGIVENYRFETSAGWTQLDDQRCMRARLPIFGTTLRFRKSAFAPVNARYFRFTALQEINRNGWTSAAEISVLPAGGNGDGR